MANEPRQILEYLYNLHSIVDVLSWIAGRFDRAIDRIEQQSSTDDILRELNTYLPDMLQQIIETQIHILEYLTQLPDTKQLNPSIRRKTGELLERSILDTISSLKIQKSLHQQSLNNLNEDAALHGAIVPLDIKNQIKVMAEKLQKTDEEIRYYQGLLKR